MSDWFESAEGLTARAWAHLAGGEAALATLREGRPQVRTVVLRGAAREAGTMEIHTDRLTAKVQAIRAQPQVALVVWRAEDDLQIRVEGEAALLDGDAHADRWANVPAGSRANYGGRAAAGDGHRACAGT